ncbi:MAG: ABC transporter ATP-binding protein [Planctomycetota bacterium]
MRELLRRLLGPAPDPLQDADALQGGLSARGLVKRFGEVPVLRELEFEVQAGQFVTFLGPSGCGKTTLLRIVAGLEQADAGELLLGGRAVGALPANRRPVNTVFQSYALFPHLSVADNIAFGLRARGLAPEVVRERVAEAVRMLRLTELEGRRPDQLSGGQGQRVALARALVNRPALLLLDEPLSALDAKLRVEVQLELRRLQREFGRTFLLVTHDQTEAMTVSDRLFVMNQGRIEQQGPCEEVYRRPRSRFVATFLGAANLLPADALDERRARTPLGELRCARALGWARGTLAIRPEWIRVRGERPAENAARATVRDVVFRGHQLELQLEVPSAGPEADSEPFALVVHQPPGEGPRPAPGEELWLELPADSLEPLVD